MIVAWSHRRATSQTPSGPGGKHPHRETEARTQRGVVVGWRSRRRRAPTSDRGQTGGRCPPRTLRGRAGRLEIVGRRYERLPGSPGRASCRVRSIDRSPAPADHLRSRRCGRLAATDAANMDAVMARPRALGTAPRSDDRTRQHGAADPLAPQAGPASEWPRGDILTPVPSCLIVHRLSVRQPGRGAEWGAVGLDSKRSAADDRRPRRGIVR